MRDKEKHKATRSADMARYLASPKGKATSTLYRASPEGKAARSAAMARYLASPKGKATTAATTARYNPLRRMLSQAKGRAKKYGIAFDLTIEELEWLKCSHCPIWEVELYYGKGKLTVQTASLDRIDPDKGYVRGNVWIISHGVNTLKNCFSPETLTEFARLVAVKSARFRF